MVPPPGSPRFSPGVEPGVEPGGGRGGPGYQKHRKDTPRSSCDIFYFTLS